jgi:multiple sugar transport system permease protein
MNAATDPQAPSSGLRVAAAGFVVAWCVVAMFPIAWIAIMSFKEPVDAFAPSMLDVVVGPRTRAAGKGLPLLDLLAVGGLVAALVWFARTRRPGAIAVAVGMIGVLTVVRLPESVFGPLAAPLVGFTTEHYAAVWIRNAFHRNFINSMMITAGVVAISLTVGTLAGYALARSQSRLAFWILIAALIFRAMPHSVLVAGYLPWFINSAEILAPILGDAAPTLYGKPFAVIVVLVSINQPFTIWLLRSFFRNIPRDLDEAARLDGCTSFQAFRYVIVPIMWPGVITAGLFSFLVGYNDYLVTSLLLDATNQTMVPAISSYFNSETTMRDQVEAVAAAVSIAAPLILLVLVFQRQIVAGLTDGATKG